VGSQLVKRGSERRLSYDDRYLVGHEISFDLRLHHAGERSWFKFRRRDEHHQRVTRAGFRFLVRTVEAEP
jgi:hypothetical protein